MLAFVPTSVVFNFLLKTRFEELQKKCKTVLCNERVHSSACQKSNNILNPSFYFNVQRNTQTWPWYLICLNLMLMPFFISISVCIGTTGRMSVPNNRDHHYRNLRDRYSNCTYVDGNLELTWLQDPDQDLSFLKDIREVTGYVLIRSGH